MFYCYDLFVALFCSHYFDMISVSAMILIWVNVGQSCDCWLCLWGFVRGKLCWISWNCIEKNYQNHINISKLYQNRTNTISKPDQNPIKTVKSLEKPTKSLSWGWFLFPFSKPTHRKHQKAAPFPNYQHIFSNHIPNHIKTITKSWYENHNPKAYQKHILKSYQRHLNIISTIFPEIGFLGGFWYYFDVTRLARGWQKIRSGKLDFKKLWQHSLGMSCSTESAPWHQFAFAVTRSTNSHWDMATCLGNRSDWKGIDWWSKMHREKSWTSWTNAQNAQNAQNAKICQVFPVFMDVSSCFVHVFVFVIFCVVLVGLLHSECWAPQTCPIRHLRPNLHFYSSPAVAAPETRSEQKRCARCVGDVPCHDQFTLVAEQLVAIQDLCSSRFLKAKLRMVIGGAPIRAVAGSSGIVVRGTVVPIRGSSRVGMQGIGIAIPGTGIEVGTHGNGIDRGTMGMPLSQNSLPWKSRRRTTSSRWPRRAEGHLRKPQPPEHLWVPPKLMMDLLRWKAMRTLPEVSKPARTTSQSSMVAVPCGSTRGEFAFSRQTPRFIQPFVLANWSKG